MPLAADEEPPDHESDPPATEDEDPAVDDVGDAEDAALSVAVTVAPVAFLGGTVTVLSVGANRFEAEPGFLLRLPWRRSSTARCLRRAGFERE